MPSTGGVFVIDITYIVVAPTDITSSQAGGGRVLSDIPSTKQTTRLWDRKVDGGFPGKSSYIFHFFFHTFSSLLFYEAKEKERLPVYVEITPSRRPLPQMQKPKPSKSLFGISSILHGTWGM